MARRLKILLSAYACEPDKGSEPEAGWQWAVRLARNHQITVVTRANNRASIEAGLARLPAPHPEVVYYDLPAWLRTLKRWGLPVTWYYAFWQLGVYWRLRGGVDHFDLIHHITFNSYRWAGFWWLTNRPLVLGPLGGGQICPAPLLKLFGPGATLERLRSWLVLVSRYNPLHRLNCRAARRLLVANQDTLERIPQASHLRTQLMLDAAIEAQLCPPRDAPATNESTVRFIWVGGLRKRKGLPLALQALATALKSKPNLRLSVVGGGPDWAELQCLARELKLEAQVTWHGWKARAEVAQLLAQHDVFLFTSVRDTSGYVLLEAMLAELPVITLNHQGAAEMTTDETAIRIPPATIPETVAALATACGALADDPARRRRMGRAGRAHVLEHHTWERRVAVMNQIYAELATELGSAN
jgi:glycosyltransferase involved in cell wall biosynthesis